MGVPDELDNNMNKFSSGDFTFNSDNKRLHIVSAGVTLSYVDLHENHVPLGEGYNLYDGKFIILDVDTGLENPSGLSIHYDLWNTTGSITNQTVTSLESLNVESGHILIPMDLDVLSSYDKVETVTLTLDDKTETFTIDFSNGE